MNQLVYPPYLSSHSFFLPNDYYALSSLALCELIYFQVSHLAQNNHLIYYAIDKSFLHQPIPSQLYQNVTPPPSCMLIDDFYQCHQCGAVVIFDKG